jgi:hypothetical protein
MMAASTDAFDILFDSSSFITSPDSSSELVLDESVDYAKFFEEYEIQDPENAKGEQIAQDESVARTLEYQFRSYSLRPGARGDGKAVWITWLDTDDSGTYDPKKPDSERRLSKGRQRTSPCQRQERPRSVYSERDDGNEAASEIEPHAAYLSRLAARQQGISITVTLGLTTTALQELAAKIPDNWPEENFNIVSDEHYQSLADQINSRIDDWKHYNLRRRSSLPSRDAAHFDFEGLVLPEGRVPDPAGDEVDLRNHPAARGCIACRELRLDCTLMADGHTWPCYNCLQDDCNCELITLPQKKATCERCCRKGSPCSYFSQGSDPAKPCATCASLGFKCVAGPAVGSIRERISYDQDYTVARNPIGEDRKFVTCTACRQGKKVCSLRRKTDLPPCTSCHEDGTQCTFQPLQRKSKSTSNPGSMALRGNQTIPASAQIKRTALNHPIHFLHEKSSECTWCTNAIGVCGRGVREVLVTLSGDGLSYTEISGGWNTNGENPERMCIACTMERCRVLGCIEHKLRPLDELHIEELDVKAMFDRVATGCPSSNDLWCRLCPSPALYQCCTPQDTDAWGEPVDPYSREAEGCGLMLCENCAAYLGELGNLDRGIDAIQSNKGAEDTWPLGVRADAELLKRDGLLVRNVLGPLDERGETMEVDGRGDSLLN